MRWTSAAICTACCLGLASSAWAIDPYAGVDPYWVLLHEPAVRDELKLSAKQLPALAKLTDDLDAQFFPLRNKTREQATAGLAALATEAQQKVNSLLEPAQQKRLQEILMRKLGTSALLREEAAAKLRFSEDQRKKVAKIVADTQSAVVALEKEANDGKPREPLEKKFVELRTDEQKQVLELLTPVQTKAWQDLIGPKFDTTQLGQPRYKAPELVNTNEWINSPPLTLAQQRGKVVAVNFYACGCINCIHNYPSYRQWQAAFQAKDVVLIGIHSPETEGERVAATVRRKAAEEKLAYPILIDGSQENWNAWGNSMWPSVYLIDKRGYLRHFWPGELKWQGNDGEKYMRERIEELLAE